MKKRSTWLLVSCLIVATLITASCTPTVTEEEEVVAPPPAEQEVVDEPCEDNKFSRLLQRPELNGERYEVMVPDTLDLQERAELAINALTRCTNPDAGYATYFSIWLAGDSPVMYRQIPLYGKFMEGLALMRIVTGSRWNEHVDQSWREEFLWDFVNNKPILNGIEGGRQLSWIAYNYQFEKDPCWQQLGEEALETIWNAATHRSNYCYFPNDSGAMPIGWEATYQGWTLQGVTQFYLATGSPIARELAEKLARYLKDYAQIFDSDAHFLARHESDMGPALHFHHNGNTLVALSEYALATGDEEFAEFARKGYEYARSLGSPLVGFFPEYIDDWPDDRDIIDSETCCVVDMILLAMTLTKAGQGDYWDDVDRYVRNQFIENQIRQGDWIEQLTATIPPCPINMDEASTDNVSERVVGSFAGWAAANDFCVAEMAVEIMNCCTGNGARAIYRVWDGMLDFNEGVLSIHLLFNRASPWADIDSYIPYEGRVDVKMKQSCAVEIRIPEWVQPEEVSCSVNGESRQLTFRERYAQIGHVQDGTIINLTFPISERTVHTTIGQVPYTLIIKGNDVISIDPSGEYYPYYQRDHYRNNQARLVTRDRFVLID